MSLSLRFHLSVILVGLSVAGTLVIAAFAYRTSRQALEQQALLAAGAVAQARAQSVVRLLAGRQERLAASLTSLEALCGERGPTGRLGLERECMRAVLVGVHTSERAAGVELRNGSRRVAARGSWRRIVQSPVAGALASFSAASGKSEYTMRAQRGSLALRALFPVGDLGPIFQDRSGLSENGEAFLIDRQGAPITPTRLQTPASLERLRGTISIQRCLAGDSGQLLDRDYGDALVISAYRPAAAIGGGCVVVNLQYSDALVPINRLGRTFMYAAAAVILLGIAVSFTVSHVITKPMARLAASAREMQEGRFDPPVHGAGPAEVRQLERAFSTMGRSIGDLVQREHTARLRAEEASRLKDTFLAMLSHELRTPLTAILGWLAMIKGGRLDETRTAHGLQVIERAAQRQQRLIEDLLDVSRLVGGRMPLQLSNVSLSAVVDEAIDAVRPGADAKQLELVKRCDAAVRAVSGDAVRLQQVVWNLLSNAVRFTPQGGRIEVSLREVADEAEIRVTDTGAGLRPDFVAHAFEPFRQADSSMTRSHGGLGLGLAIVRHLVELHGGTVQAESAGEGQGASFTVRLPIRTRESAVDRGVDLVPRANPATSLSGTHVLVVDDDPDTREILRVMLEDAGATVATTASAEETRATLGRLRPDLLIADIGMPDEDGYSLIRSVRALESDVTRRVPAIALTAHAQAADVDRALASGFQVHLAKPVEASQLVSTVATLVRRSA